MTCCIFGWRSHVTKKRRFWEVYACLPRKSGKSIWAAAVGHLMFAMDGENGAEVYCGATSEGQAWEVYRPARIMAQKTPDYMHECGVQVNAKTMVLPDDNSRFEPVIGDPGDGASPSCFILDERHEHKNDNMYDTAKTGMGSREQPLLLTITTAGSTIGGPCYKQQKAAEKVVSGAVVNDRLFVLIYQMDVDDDWTSREALRKANPNIGVSVSEEFLFAMQDEAMNDSSKTNAFKTKHLNLWVASKTAWLNILKWNKCEDETLDIKNFEGMDCIRSVDLASKRDFACYLRLFPVKTDKLYYYVFPKFYLPEKTIENDRTNQLAPWVADGWLTPTDGEEIDFEVIENDILEDEAIYNFVASPYDKWQALQFARNLENKNILMEPYSNSASHMSEAMDEVQTATYTKRLFHNANPIMTWMMSNVVAKSTDGGETNKPVKEGYENKIDGPVALIMGVGANMRIELEEPAENVYRSRGVRSL
nr:terminase TerL endonuclease subunit [uncultured Paraglaciecola sp.]